MSTSSLIARIASAFPLEPAPQPEDILYNEEAGYTGSFPVDSELAEIKAFFGNRRWNAVTPQDVFHFRHALSFFSKSALAYHTAGWMTCCLVDAAAVDTAIEDLVYTFGKADANLWTRKQRQAICEWWTHFDFSQSPSSKSAFERAMKHMRRASAA